MKISKLIADLQEQLNEHGDLEVLVLDRISRSAYPYVAVWETEETKSLFPHLAYVSETADGKALFITDDRYWSIQGTMNWNRGVDPGDHGE